MKRFNNAGGGGRFLSSCKAFLEGCKKLKICYNSDMLYHDYIGDYMRRKSAFTLAEVLVTLGIIGVVSAMTVPSLMQNYQRQSYVTQLHKVYNEFSQSLLRYQNDKNAINLTEAGLNSQAQMNSFVSSYFKVVQTCTNSLTPCFIEQNSYKKMNGTALNSAYTVTNAYVLASGASVRFLYAPSGDKIGNIMVDINGQKGPNILGRDLFTIAVYKNGMMDDTGTTAPLSKDTRNTSYTSMCASAGNSAWGCFGKILNDNWEMTY